MINAKVKVEIMRHARDVYPNECCGVVTQKSRVQKYHRIDNINYDPVNHFDMEPQQYADALECGELIAIVHSHTGDGATTIPSVHDIAMCNEMGVLSVIVSIPEGDMRVMNPENPPLIGRPWHLGSYDCWGLVMAYHKERGIELNDFRKPYEWWKREHGENLYQDNYLIEGFVPTNADPVEGDMIIMQLQAEVWNHAGIYIGNNQILHHAFGKLSKTDIYSGWYQEHTTMICRHKDLV